jgi:hypothetical protein
MIWGAPKLRGQRNGCTSFHSPSPHLPNECRGPRDILNAEDSEIRDTKNLSFCMNPRETPAYQQYYIEPLCKRENKPIGNVKSV